MTRILFINTVRSAGWLGRFFTRLRSPFQKWLLFNFSYQDYNAARTVQYQYPEYLSSTDNYLVALRRLIVRHGRGMERVEGAPEESAEERMVIEGDELVRAKPET